MNPQRNQVTKTIRSTVVALAMAGLLTAAAGAQAGILYWDTNGSAAGAGNPASATWNTAALWNTVSDGTGTPVSYVNNSDVVFSAGNDAASAAVAVSGTKTVNSMTFEEGAVTLSGSTVNVGSGGVTVNSGAGPVSISSALFNGTTAMTTISLDATGAASGTQLTIGSYAHSVTVGATTTYALVMVDGTNLGTAAPGTANTANLMFTNAPALVGSGSAGATDVGVLKHTFSTGPIGLVTYDSVTGVRALTSSEYVNTMTANQNVVLDSVANLTADITVQSLQITGGGQITGAKYITVSSGDVLATGGVNGGIDANFGTANDLTITTINDLSIRSILGGSLFTKYGAGTLTVNGRTDCYITVNEGTMVVVSDGYNKGKSLTVRNDATFRYGGNNAIGDGVSASLSTDATLDFNGYTDKIGSFAGDGTVTGGSGVTANVTLTGTNSSAFTGIVTGNINITKISGTQTFSGSVANDYVGLTTITGGTLALNKSAGIVALPGDAIVSDAGTLQLLANEQIADTATVTLNDGGTFNLGAFSETLAEMIVSGSTMNVLGGGELFLTSLDVNGVQQGAGTYTNADFAWIAADGSSITVVPEPATLSLLALGGLTFIRRSRRA